MSERVRIIIDAPEEHVAQAIGLVCQELNRRADYDKSGWGWPHRYDGRVFFVRGIKGGLSCKFLRKWEGRPEQASISTKSGDR